MDDAKTPAHRSQAAQDERRRDILQAAIDLFQHQGFLGTTADEIAASAGITKRTLYRYIGSKDRLLLEIHANFVQDGLTAWEAVIAQGGSATETLRHLITAHIQIVVNHQAAIRVHVEEWKHLSETDRASMVDQRDAYEKILRDTLAAGMATGEFRRSDLAMTTRLVLGTLTDVYRWYHADVGMGMNELADFLAGTIMSGLRASVGV
jgi:AcrR family transcriptional regulator